jgi:hypothetical protein
METISTVVKLADFTLVAAAVSAGFTAWAELHTQSVMTAWCMFDSPTQLVPLNDQGLRGGISVLEAVNQGLSNVVSAMAGSARKEKVTQMGWVLAVAEMVERIIGSKSDLAKLPTLVMIHKQGP